MSPDTTGNTSCGGISRTALMQELCKTPNIEGDMNVNTVNMTSAATLI